MHISSIVLKGFKTYRDITLSEGFSPGCNVLIGYNGSGKSTIVDAILFVLSDTVSRSTKGEKAIAHEGEVHALANGYVEVVIDNPGPERRIAINEDVVRIRRHLADKSYQINGRPIQRTEIHPILDAAGISTKNPYYAIRQGQIAEVARFSSKQRFQIISEVLGANAFMERKEQILGEIKDMKEKQDRGKEILEDLERRIAKLKDEGKEMEKLSEKETQKRDLELKINLSEAQLVEKRLVDLSKDKNGAAKKRDKVSSKLGASQEKANKLIASAQEKELEISEANLACLELRETRDRLAQRVKAVEVVQSESSISSKSDKQGHAAQLKEAKVKLERLCAAEKEDAVGKVAKRKHEILAELESLGVTFDSASFKNRASELDNAIKDGDRDVRILEQDIGTMNTTELPRLKTECQQGATDLKTAEGKLISAKRSLEDVTENIRQAMFQSNKLIAEATNLAKDRSEKRQQLANLTPPGVRSVLRYFEEKGYPSGVRGTLLDNITVDADYRIAVEAVGAGAVFNLLADTDNVAAEIITAVRKQKLGHIEVVPISRVKPPTRTPPTQLDKHDLISLASVVHTADWAKPVVQSVFGAWIICENLEVCEKVANQTGFNAVTLDGDRVYSSGICCGGHLDHRYFQRLDISAKLRSIEQRSGDCIEQSKKLDTHMRTVLKKQRDLACETRAQAEQHYKQVMEQCRSSTANLQQVQRQMQSKTESLQRAKAKQKQMSTELQSIRSRRPVTSQVQSSQAHDEQLKKLEKEYSDLNESEQRLRAEAEERQRQKEKLQVMRDCLTGLDREGHEDLMLENVDELRTQRDEMESKLETMEKKLVGYVKEQEALVRQRNENDKDVASLSAEADKAKHDFDKILAKFQVEEKRKEGLSKSIEALQSTRGKHMKKIQKPSVADLPYLRVELTKLNITLGTLLDCENRRALVDLQDFIAIRNGLTNELDALETQVATLQDSIEKVEASKEKMLHNLIKSLQTEFSLCFREITQTGEAELLYDQNEKALQLFASFGSDAIEHRQDNSDASMAIEGASRDLSAIEKSGVGSRLEKLKMTNVNELSGGQKSCCALSFLMALLRLRKAPFYLLDEVDAALDIAYVSNFARFLRQCQYSNADSALAEDKSDASLAAAGGNAEDADGDVTMQTDLNGSNLGQVASKNHSDQPEMVQIILASFQEKMLDAADKIFAIQNKNRSSTITVSSREDAAKILGAK